MVKKIIDKGIKHAPDFYNYGTKKVKNKNLKKHLNLILQITLLKKHRKNFLTGKMSKGITNFQTKTVLKNINDPDIDDNFVGVFSANHMNGFTDYKSMISEKSAGILSS